MKFKFKHPWSVIDRMIPGDARKTDNDFHNACNYGSYRAEKLWTKANSWKSLPKLFEGKKISPIEVSRQKSGCDLWIIIILRSQSVHSSITSARYLLFILFWRLWLDDFLSPKKKYRNIIPQTNPSAELFNVCHQNSCLFFVYHHKSQFVAGYLTSFRYIFLATSRCGTIK